jgi:predicted NBD/HSP70 family sugar kinase
MTRTYYGNTLQRSERRQPMSTGPGDVLRLIRRGESTTRKEIQEATGLSRMTVAQRVDALIEAGLMVDDGSGTATGGRRPSKLRFDTAHSVLAVATVDTTHSRVAVTDLAGSVLAEESLDVPITDGPERVLKNLAAAFDGLLEGAGKSREQLSGVGLSVPGPVDAHSGRLSQPPIMPGWDAYPVIEHLQDSLPVPVFVENDADAMAFGEYSAAAPSCEALCLVKVSTGIGTGLVINGSIYHGIDGGAGDIGHIRLDGVDALCQCGSRGCLAAVASGRAVAAALTTVGIPARSGRDVRRHINDGNVEALRLAHDAGHRIGQVMATVVSMVNPGMLIISGDLASSPLLAGIRETLYARSLPRATRNLEVRLSSLGENAGLIGMARIVADALFSAQAINRKLAS